MLQTSKCDCGSLSDQPLPGEPGGVVNELTKEEPVDEFGDFDHVSPPQESFTSDRLEVPPLGNAPDTQPAVFGNFEGVVPTSITMDYSKPEASALSVDDAFGEMGIGIQNAPLPSLDSLGTMSGGEEEGKHEDIYSDFENVQEKNDENVSAH